MTTRRSFWARFVRHRKARAWANADPDSLLALSDAIERLWRIGLTVDEMCDFLRPPKRKDD